MSVTHQYIQKEDGIRDHCVTGVQTCALPISQDPPFIKIITGFFALIVVPPGSSLYSPGPWLMMTGESAPSSVSNERISHSLPSWRATTSSTDRKSVV